MRKASTIKIGKILKQIRKSNGYTQEKLAEKIEVSVRYVSDFEQDKAKPSYEVLIRFCNLFEITLDQIFNKQLKARENKILEYSLVGFENLSDDEKATIEHLITYFNTK